MKKQYKQYYYPDTDTFWVVFKKGIENSYKELMPGFNLELDKNSNPIGLEIQNFSRLIKIDSNTQKNTVNKYKTPNFSTQKLYPASYNTNNTNYKY